jgi:hypothetical protein
MKTCKHIDFQIPIPFGYTVEQTKSPFVKEYNQMFDKLDLSNIEEFNSKSGATGYSRHALIRACIVYACEGYRSIPQLIKELKSKPYFSKYVIGFKDTIPHATQFYRFINSLNPEKIRELLSQVNRKYYGKKLPKVMAIDSKPIKANTKQNNPKAFIRNLTNKTIKPDRNEDCTLSYFSKSNDQYKKKETVVFFWGYRVHIIVDAENDNPLIYKLEPNNKNDGDIALYMYKDLVKYYPELYLTGINQLGDKGYYQKKVFEDFHFLFGGKSFIPRKKEPTMNPPKIPVCKNDYKMKYHSSWFEKNQQRFRVKFVCPLKKNCQLRNTKNGCTKYLQVRKPYKGEVQQMSAEFQKIYPKRQSVERVNAYLQNLRWENPKNFFINGIENIIGFALLGKALKL